MAYLKPNLSDPFAQTGHCGDPFEIRSIWITIDLKVGLQYCQLLLGKRCSYSFCFCLWLSWNVSSVVPKNENEDSRSAR